MRSSPRTFSICDLEVVVPWGVIAAKCWGSPSSKPVLVVHGLQDNAGSFDRLIPMLPDGFYYVCVDLPGHGRSSMLPEGFHMDFMQYNGMLRRFVKHFNWSRYYILGHSLGGQLGLCYSAMYPEEVIKIILLDTMPTLGHAPEEFLDYHRDLTEELLKLEMKMSKFQPPKYTFEEAVDRMVEKRFTPITKEAATALAHRGLKESEGGFQYSADQRLKFGVKHPMPLEQCVLITKKVKCPVLLICTNILKKSIESEDKNGKVKPVFKALKKMKNVTIVLVDGSHDVHNNDPHVVAPHVCQFLNDMKSHL